MRKGGPVYRPRPNGVERSSRPGWRAYHKGVFPYPEAAMTTSDPTPPAGRSVGRRLMHALRRAHLYLGLFLAPWAVLYGVTAFLFNHPSAFSDQPTTTFGRDAVRGTPAEAWPSAAAQAERVVAALNAKQSPATPYRLAGPAKFNREFAFATVKTGGDPVGVLFDPVAGGGTLRVTPAEPVRKEVERAPFAVGRTAPDAPRARTPRPAPAADDGLKLDDPPHERLKAAIPTILERSGFPAGEVTVTSVPEVVFPIEADGRIWTATYNPMTGAVGGKPADAEEKPELTWRRYLLRLHTAHGYPGEANAKWYWALVVDATAFVLCFWAASGLLMWWQVKATRRAGLVVLLLSAAAATALGVAMHSALAG